MPNDDSKKDGSDPSPKLPPQAKKRLEKFLSALCDAKGLGSAPRADKKKDVPAKRTPCKCPCADAEWRAQLDIEDGVICVYSKVTRRDADGPHRDVTLAVTYVNEEGEPDYADITFCDSEVRWIMEALWHAPIWE
jgi:hypothetical protein